MARLELRSWTAGREGGTRERDLRHGKSCPKRATDTSHRGVTGAARKIMRPTPGASRARRTSCTPHIECTQQQRAPHILSHIKGFQADQPRSSSWRSQILTLEGAQGLSSHSWGPGTSRKPAWCWAALGCRGVDAAPGGCWGYRADSCPVSYLMFCTN